MKPKSLKIIGKEYGFLTTYIANCAQLYAFCKDKFLVRIGGKLRRVRYYSYYVFNYHGHICLSELILNLQTVMNMIGVISKRVMTEGMHNDRLIVLPEGQHPEVL
jgi:hypothetical protein